MEKIINDNYDKSLAVKCANGTFVGKKTDELIILKGIPYATLPPTATPICTLSGNR